MNNQELIAKFNPTNAANLSAEDLETLRTLTDDQIDVLAGAYPNQPTRRAYLILYDQNLAENKQLYQLSTWQNLRNVRKFANRKNLIPWTFQSIFLQVNKTGTTSTQARPSAQRVQVDLTANEASDELKKALAEKQSGIQQQTVGNTAQTRPGAQGNRPARKTIKTSGQDMTNSQATNVTQEADESFADAGSIPDDQQFTQGE